MRQFSLLFVFGLFLLPGCFAQRPVGTENKKALAAFNKALENLNTKRFKEAIAQTDKAIEADENYIDAYLLKGQLHEELGEAEAALAHWKRW